MFVLGIAGTAKNTGKTTTTMAVLKMAAKKKLRVALTSIGYDGEKVDNVTGLPKPRIDVGIGDIVVTGEKCLKWGSAGVEILDTIKDISIPLGKITISRVVKPGKVVIAGPNKGIHLERVIKMAGRYQVDLMVVDGALNRLAPMVQTKGIVLATGAARNTEISQLVRETKALVKIFNLPDIESDVPLEYNSEHISVIDEKKSDFLPTNSLMTPQEARLLAGKISDGTEKIIIPGMVDCLSFQELLKSCSQKLSGKSIIFHDPIKLIVGGNPIRVSETIEAAKLLGLSVKVIKEIPIYLITINPFYPAYSFKYNTYSPAYVDSTTLKSMMQEAVQTQIVDVLKDSEEEINALLHTWIKKCS